MNNISFGYTASSIVAILGAVLAVVVSFGLHLTQDNIHTILLMSGIVLGALATGGGIKDNALIRGNIKLPNWLHFTPAALVAAVGGIISLVVSFGLHLTQQNIDSVNLLVGLVAAGIIGGGAAVSHGAFRAGVHPGLKGVKQLGQVTTQSKG